MNNDLFVQPDGGQGPSTLDSVTPPSNPGILDSLTSFANLGGNIYKAVASQTPSAAVTSQATTAGAVAQQDNKSLMLYAGLALGALLLFFLIARK